MVANPGKSKGKKPKSTAKSATVKKVGKKKEEPDPEIKWDDSGDDTAPEVKAKIRYIEPPESVEDLKAHWRVYSREIAEWRSQPFEERVLAQSWLRKLTTSQKELIYATLPAPITSVESIYAVLKANYGCDEQLQGRSDELAYRAHKRTTESVRAFMTKHTILRHTALSGGMSSDSLAGGFSLLEAANLSTAQKEQILRNIKTTSMLRREAKLPNAPLAGQPPSYDEICAELDLLIQVYELDAATETKPVLSGVQVQKKVFKKNKKTKLKTVTQQLKQVQAAMTTLLAGAGKGSFDWICPDCKCVCFANRETCFKCDAKRPLNPARAPSKGKGKGGKGKSNGGGKGKSEERVCHHFQKSGTCSYGDTCKFVHGVVKKE